MKPEIQKQIASEVENRDAPELQIILGQCKADRHRAEGTWHPEVFYGVPSMVCTIADS